jgi:hypothetical protein
MADRSASAAGTRARHEAPRIDELALDAARRLDRLVAAADARGLTRWTTYLAPLPDRLRDDALPGLRTTAARVRSAYGPKDSVRDALPAELTEPVLEAIDRLIKELNREAHRRAS